jgi:hypothetical protein
MSEEIESPALNVPRAMVTTVVLNGGLGYAMILAVLFCLGDMGAVVVCFFLHMATRIAHHLHRIPKPSSHLSKSSTMRPVELAQIS